MLTQDIEVLKIMREQYKEQGSYSQTEALTHAIKVLERIDEEKFKIRLEEVRKSKCLICKYHYDRNSCIMYQVKNRDRCSRDLTDKEIIKTLITYLEGGKG